MLNLLHTQWDNHATHAPYHTLTNSDFIRQTAPIKVILSTKQRRELSRRILADCVGCERLAVPGL